MTERSAVTGRAVPTNRLNKTFLLTGIGTSVFRLSEKVVYGLDLFSRSCHVDGRRDANEVLLTLSTLFFIHI